MPEREPIIYILVDGEMDGPRPGQGSLLNIGAIALNSNGDELGEYEVNLKPLPGQNPHPPTMEWWGTQPPEVWDRITRNAREPKEVIEEFVAWVRQFPGDKLFVAHPIRLDFTWVDFYLSLYVENYDRKDLAEGKVFTRPQIDMETYITATYGCDPRDSSREKWPADWLDPVAHTHVGIDDVREYVKVFRRVLADNKRLGRERLENRL